MMVYVMVILLVCLLMVREFLPRWYVRVRYPAELMVRDEEEIVVKGPWTRCWAEGYSTGNRWSESVYRLDRRGRVVDEIDPGWKTVEERR